MRNCLGFVFFILLVTSGNGSCKEELPYGRDVSVDNGGGVITINRKFLEDFRENPHIRLASSNFWEFIYFINLGDREALKAGLIMLSKDQPIDLIHDRYGYQYLSRALSQSEAFWYVLTELSEPEIRSILNYYNKYPEQYENMEGFEFMENNILKGLPK